MSDRYARRQMKKAQKREKATLKPLEEMHFVIEQCVIPTLLIMKGHCNVGNLAMVEKGIENLLDSFSGFIYDNNATTITGENHGNAVESKSAITDVPTDESAIRSGETDTPGLTVIACENHAHGDRQEILGSGIEA